MPESSPTLAPALCSLQARALGNCSPSLNEGAVQTCDRFSRPLTVRLKHRVGRGAEGWHCLRDLSLTTYDPVMGTWGEGPFDNDTAADWVFEFGEADQLSGLNHIQSALARAASLGADDYLESDAGVEAVAAAELVAAIRGLVIERSPSNEAALDWVARTTPVAGQAIMDLALTALDRVVSANSELAELWDETESASWRASVESRRVSLAW